MPYLSASAVMVHYEEALYQVYAPLPLPLSTKYIMQFEADNKCTDLSLSLRINSHFPREAGLAGVY